MNPRTTPIQLTRQDRVKIFGEMVAVFLKERSATVRTAASLLQLPETHLQGLIDCGNFTMTELLLFAEVFHLDPMVIMQEFHLCCTEVAYGKPIGTTQQLPWGRYILTKNVTPNPVLQKELGWGSMTSPVRSHRSSVVNGRSVSKARKEKREQRRAESIQFYNENKHLADCTLEVFISRTKKSREPFRHRLMMPRRGVMTAPEAKYFKGNMHIATVCYTHYLKRLQQGMAPLQALTADPTEEELQFVFTE